MMNFLKKFKSFFTSKSQVTEQIPKIPPKAKKEIEDRKVICFLCDKEIYPDERSRDLNGMKVHKRCAKKATKAVMEGKTIHTLKEEIVNNGKGGNE